MNLSDDDSTKKRPHGKPILRREIEEAQRHTNSNVQAAKYLNTSYLRYKKYAKLYGLFDSHMNQAGIGIDKGWSKHPKSTPLREILAGMHPNYSRSKLKNRLVARKKLEEKCALCGFSEQRITDKRAPLILSFKDNNPKNFALENLELLCYNCMFLTTHAPTAAYRKGIHTSLYKQQESYHQQTLPTVADQFDPAEDMLILSDDERQQLLSELLEE